MALSNYTELRAAMADTLNRDDLTNQIPDFIKLGESQLIRDVRHWRMEDRATALVDSQYTALPSNFIEPIRLTIPASETHTLDLVSPMEVSKLREDNGNTTGRPQQYAVVDGSFEVFPVPDTDYTVELVYYEEIPDLATNNTNWVLTYFPNSIFYGSLLHSAPFLQEDARVQVWNALYQQAISAINYEGQAARSSGSGRAIKIRSY
jgi:hypothetical protein|tara:strand:- start:204 stop:821 length:618 start_codon:yes stop_codon:yes gene_type:complete